MEINWKISKGGSLHLKNKAIPAEVKIFFDENESDDEDQLYNELKSLKLSEEFQEKGAQAAELGEYQSALAYFQKSVYISQNNFKALEMQAQVYLEVDEVFLALKSAEAAVSINPNWSIGLHTLARCQREMGEVSFSFESYKLASQLDPENEEIKTEIAEIEILVQQLEEKKKELLAKLVASSNEDVKQQRQCMYHLCHRAHCLSIETEGTSSDPSNTTSLNGNISSQFIELDTLEINK
jgi:tetratricopeptide (TPR) repeat protein